MSEEDLAMLKLLMEKYYLQDIFHGMGLILERDKHTEQAKAATP